MIIRRCSFSLLIYCIDIVLFHEYMFFAHYDILNLNFTLIVIHLLSVFVYLKNNKMNHVNGVLIFKRNITLRILNDPSCTVLYFATVSD